LARRDRDHPRPGYADRGYHHHFDHCGRYHFDDLDHHRSGRHIAAGDHCCDRSHQRASRNSADNDNPCGADHSRIVGCPADMLTAAALAAATAIAARRPPSAPPHVAAN
jgi:hypothetical protein